MKIRIAAVLAVSLTLAVLPAAEANIINGTCDDGSAQVAATGSDGTGNSSTALTGWTFKLSQTPYGNFYIGKNIQTWNQRPGYTVAGVGMAFHANPSGKSVEAYQTVTGLEAGELYDVSAWLVSVLVSGKPSGAVLTLGLKNPTTGDTVWGDAIGDLAEERGVWTNTALTQAADDNGEIMVRIVMDLGQGGWTAKSTPNACFDDVTVTLVPEPCTLIALLGGSAGIALVRRRRR